MSQRLIPFFVTMPHSGEKIPEKCTWLKNLPEEVLMCDVDRFIDVIYEPSLNKLNIAYHKTQWHRFAVDLNRIPTDIDASSVVGSLNPAGSFSRGYHWVVTTHNDKILPHPILQDLHQELTDLIYTPFHARVRELFSQFKDQGFTKVYHIDAHSMPSLGTNMHKDPGERRADIVISDSLGKSCSKEFRDLVIAAYVTAGFKVGYNWPYVGGRLTEQYGQPQLGQHTIQVELNRALYMDEVKKKLKPESAPVQKKIEFALKYVQEGLVKLHAI